MIINNLFKISVTACLLVAVTPAIQAQTQHWYQRYLPQYNNENTATYQYPQYRQDQQYQYQYQQYPQYQQQQQQQQLAPQAPAPKAKAPTSKSRGYSSSQVDNSRWYSEFNAAWTQAKKQGRPLVALFVHHGCPECDRMDAILAQPAAMHTLDNAVKVRIEFTENAALVNQFGLKYTPTFMVFSPTTGAEAYREVGALSVDRLRQIQPSIDSLVTGPAPEQTRKQSRRESNADDDTASTRTIASL